MKYRVFSIIIIVFFLLKIPVSIAAISADLPYTKGVLEFAKGNYKKAGDYFNKALKIEKNHLMSGYYLGLSYSALSKHQRAFSAFKQVYESNKQFKPVLVDLGITLVILERFDESLQFLEKAMISNPERKELDYYLGYALYKKRKFKKAQFHLNRIVKRNGSSLSKQAAFYLALTEMELGQLKSAKKTLERIALDQDAQLAGAAQFMMSISDIKRKSSSKRLYVFLTNTFEYDNNVLQIPMVQEDNFKNKKKSSRYVINTGLSYSPFLTKKWRIKTDGIIYRNIHFNDEVKELNLTEFAAGISASRIYSKNGFELSFNILEDLLDGSDENSNNNFTSEGIHRYRNLSQLRFSWLTNQIAFVSRLRVNTMLHLEYYNNYKNDDNSLNRDNIGLRTEVVIFTKPYYQKIDLLFGLNGGMNKAQGKNYDQWLINSFVKLFYNSNMGINPFLTLKYMYKNHYNSDWQDVNRDIRLGKRQDKILSFSTGINLQLNNWIKWNLSYRLDNRWSSISDYFDYNKYVLSTGITLIYN